MSCKKTLVQGFTLIFQHSHRDVNSCLSQHFHSSSAHFFKWVEAAHHHSLDAFFYQELGAWWRFAIVRTWLKSDIDSALVQHTLVVDAGDGIYLGMSLPTLAVKSLSHNHAIAHYHRAHHGIGGSVSRALPCQL